MAIHKRGWNKGAVMAYQRMGTIKERHKCEFCGTQLTEPVVLLVQDVDGEIAGNSYTCESCADEVTLKEEGEKRGGSTGSVYDDKRLNSRGPQR